MKYIIGSLVFMAIHCASAFMFVKYCRDSTIQDIYVVLGLFSGLGFMGCIVALIVNL